jgi:hypothetical protein
MQNKNSAGNVVIIILVAVALFGALTFTLSKSMNGGNSDELNSARATIYANQIITYSADVEGAINQMIFNGSGIDDFNFILPSDAAFETGSDIYKVFHPDGGGVNYKKIPQAIIEEATPTPSPDWYLGLFNNTEWTETAAFDVMLTAYQIKESVCEEINNQLIGSKNIPVLGDDLQNRLIDTATNLSLNAAVCSGCDGHASLCVENGTGNAWAFYSVVSAR